MTRVLNSSKLSPDEGTQTLSEGQLAAAKTAATSAERSMEAVSKAAQQAKFMCGHIAQGLPIHSLPG